MALRVKADPSKTGGGFALLSSDASLPARVGIEDRSSGLYLGTQGEWSKARVYLAVDPVDIQSVRLGPQIVDHIPSDTPIALYDEAGTLLGNLVWKGIRVSAGLSGHDGHRIGEDRPVPITRPGANAAQNDEAPGNEGEDVGLPPLPAPLLPPVIRPLPPAEPRKGIARAVLIALALFMAFPALGFMGMQMEGARRALVCDPTAVFHDSTLMNRWFPCIAAASDDTPYASFLECTSGKSGCGVQSCAQAYLGSSRNTLHRDIVERARQDAEKVCRVTEAMNSGTAALQKLNECVASSAVCNQSQCIARYEDALKAEPFALQLRQITQRVTDTCHMSQEATAYAAFNQCVSRTSTCDKARCADAYLSQFPNGTNSAEVSRVKLSSENTCRSDEDSKANFAKMNDCLRTKPNSCDQKACFDQFSPGIRNEPYLTNARQFAQTASDMCSRSREETAFASFNQCMSLGSSCDRAKCGQPFLNGYPSSSHVSQVLQATTEAARTCSAQSVPTMSPEDAARRFVTRIYEQTMSATQGSDLFNLYAPNIDFYGTMTPRNQVLDEKTKYLARWTQRKFYLQSEGMTTNCDNSSSCRVAGRVTFDVSNATLNRRGITTFEYTISDVLRAPRISAESGKVEQRF
jgi:hypothetical protein